MTTKIPPALAEPRVETNASAITAGTGWTELVNVATGGLYYDSSQSQSRTGSTATSVLWNDVGAPTYAYKVVAVAIEIKAAT